MRALTKSEPPSADSPGASEPTPASRSDGEDRFRDYRAPRGDGEVLFDPALDGVEQILELNRLRAPRDGFWTNLRRQAREQLVADAVRYTSAYRDVPSELDAATAPLLMAGHQPTLFHPGVWFKNFALAHLGDRHEALAVNLVVDNDVALSRAVRVPRWDSEAGRARYEVVPYDRAGGGVPHEQTEIRDRECFDRFDRAVGEAIAPLVPDPCVYQLWKHARAAADRCSIAGCVLGQARHALEGELGLSTLELPLGVACRDAAFATFTWRILSELERFHRIYNDSTARYRAAHGIRSLAHPVPNLGRRDEWLEAPFWLYGDRSPGRRPVWVRRSRRKLEISDGNDRRLTVETRDDEPSLDGLEVEQMLAAASPDFKLRPRALVTTMYARLVLSDLFVHGIGGGKYDQLGDLIAQEFFEVQPPGFLVLSATVRLPGTEPIDPIEDPAEIRSELRATHYHAEHFAHLAPVDRSLIARKRELLADIPPRGAKGAWHNEISEVNRRLAKPLSGHREHLRLRLAAAESRLQSERILCSREHPFCLFPLDELAKTLQGMLPASD